MKQQKRFRVVGTVRPTAKPKESDGVLYEWYFDTLKEAESFQREQWRCGWGGIKIIDLEAMAKSD